jgi:hypothetical protein
MSDIMVWFDHHCMSLLFVQAQFMRTDQSHRFHSNARYLLSLEPFLGWRGFTVDFLFTLTFGLSRFGIGTPLLYAEYMAPKAHWFMKLGATLLYAVSVIWYFAIVKMFYRTWLGKQRKTRRDE